MRALFRYSRYGFAAAALLALATLQVSGAVSFFGLVPNLVLSALVALLFYFESFGEILLLSGAALGVLNWTRGVSWELVAFAGAVCAVFVLKRFSHWHFIIETALLAGAAAIVFALLADPAYLFLFPARFGVELLYVELAAFLSLGVLMLVYGPPQNETRRA
ncbi:MAG: hypothetical protein A2128_00535 [Candidatus Liptonbacteria bacterium GWC1_60_9]|uniref:Rod shape-determining protein MreD n=3 Tax=Candidatus Liptoniibacteriota TaxID=1817909 RepID=A0A1G2CJ92_9BACT|nr:MAG: hypothetical protein UZ00_C0002G0009 [Parcubacteria group bacterium GW2011_GWA1_60_11]OGY97333.1 MAG: hypothetical protein A2128_00535 [Candidatus Liptonbacteria bacterium GWC1_60_9]OGY98753.1 MAG: hypothetical protein A3E09_01305 [Candidatus Liptonbacteria bacterium RIFCSPHIGHO2_12_FULL_60_13]OGZ01474.1 MAG: hypothetical protein A3G64_01395 [Candidatus Liptonbacteria bacterium RIFCSPLOWO2_12_FULL_60_15]